MRIRALPAIDVLRAVLNYDPATGVLTWRKTGKGRKSVEAGFISSNGYLRIGINRSTFLVHRVAFAMHHGRDSAMELDHIDGNRLNNKIDNLREASRSQNARNLGGWSSVLKGVQRHPQRKRNPYVARICIDGRVTHIGCFSTAEAAHAAYLAEATRHWGEFATGRSA